MKLFLFRAGEVNTKEAIFLGWINFTLSKRGLESAKKVSKKLEEEKIDFAFCSDQLRAKQALAEVLDKHRKTIVFIEHRLRERNYGIFTGHEKKLFKKYFPEKYDEVHRGYHGQVPKGENFYDVSKRVFSFMNDLLRFSKLNEGNVLICAHNNSLKLIREYLEGLSRKEVEALEQSPSELKEYEVTIREGF
jgi:2,3-bisphosphoglycerate-dependent phosphoglycerate mutase